MKVFILQFIGVLFFSGLLFSQASVHRHRFVVKEAPYTRLCSTKNILTVDGQFPGPVLYANTGDTFVVDVYNQGSQNITIHWHGVKQPRYPWSDGPEFITQCPIRPGTNFSQTIKLSDEEGTLWWHAHSDWSRATVHGAIVIRPANKTQYPFPKPDGEIPIILGEWWKSDVQAVLNDFVASGGDPNISDAYLINGQPGDLYPCSRNGTYKLTVDDGKTYLLRMVNAVMNNQMFFSIANHQLTVVGSDGAYLKPFKANYIIISPGQTIDLLLEANQPHNHYYMAARAYSSNPGITFDNTTTTATLQYRGNYTPTQPPSFPNYLPNNTDRNASVNFTGKFRFLATKTHQLDVPLNVTNNLLFTFSINTLPCANESCQGPNGDRFAASVNNISFVLPRIDILEAYYRDINGIYGDDFPSVPPLRFNFTGDSIPVEFQTADRRTKVHVLEYGSKVEIVFQGTNLLGGLDHPIHLHGQSFYVVGLGLGNFNNRTARLNVVDPPLQNTIAVPRNGWAAVRFTANNPGVWFLHCHFDRHLTWGMDMAFIVRDGKGSQEKLLPPPPDMPKC